VTHTVFRWRPRAAAVLLAGVALGWPGCGAPKPARTPGPAPAPKAVSVDTKVAWILRLEQQRVLRDPAVAAEPPQAPAAPGQVAAAPPGAGAPPALAPATAPDLAALVADTDPGVRRRAALAIGRVGLAEGVPPLVRALGDPDEEVRATAAFALGLLGSADGVAPLESALKDPSVRVRGRAAEGLGLIGQALAASAVADAASGCATQLSGIEPDDETWPKTPEVELCRLSLFALVRLHQYDALARVALDAQGQPVSRWWPVAYALQRMADRRAVPALLALASSTGVYTPAFALRGLAAAHETRARPLALAVATRPTADVRLRAAAIRALGAIGGADAVQPLLGLLGDPATPRNLALEAVTALGAIGDHRAFDPLLDLFTDPWPTMRSAAFAAAARIDPNGFLLVVSSLGPDPDWSVRAALASVFATLPAEHVRGAIEDMTDDPDARVRGPALEALAEVGAPDLTARLYKALDAPDFVLRATAARLVGQTRPPDGEARLVAAYKRAQTDAAYGARTAALAALARYGDEEAKATLLAALDDSEWPVRLEAARLLHGLGDTTAAAVRPAPLRQTPAAFEAPALLHPAYSPHAFIEMAAGTIEVELDVVDAPLTTQSFIELARAGFFNGLKIARMVPNFVVQAGDPRGDGEGGPGYTIQDELSPLPYLTGTVGMALDGPDTGGSQFFVTLSPQPHLDAKYTVFGKVVHGQQILDEISQWDVIQRIRIWDGVKFEP
jgi:HEAT repeat protein/cyclophilin family peptidyl-prolyl cis-trans isomerase